MTMCKPNTYKLPHCNIFQVVRGFLRKGTSGEASGLPFVAGALNCGIWFKYALLIDDTAMKLVNGIGVLLLSSSAAIFYKYTPNRTSVLKQIVFAVGFFATISFYVNSVSTNSTKILMI